MPDFTFYPHIDGDMEGIATPSQTRGAYTATVVGVAYSGETKAFLWRTIAFFDVGSIAGGTITAAKLRLYTTGGRTGGAAAATVYRCTRPLTVVESQFSWNNYKTGTAWTTAGGDYDGSTPTPVGFTHPASSGWHEITGLSGFVTDAIANRQSIVALLLRDDDEDPGANAYVSYDSKEGTNAPQLVVTCTPRERLQGILL